MAAELIIFDCDGVLVDTEPISNAVLAEMVGEQGLLLTVAQTRQRFQGKLLVEVVEDLERTVGAPLPGDWIEQYEERRDEAFRAGLQAVPGVRELVGGAREAGVAVCVASQGRLRKVSLTLSLAGLDGLFPVPVRFSAEQVARGKPHPDLFLHAARTMGVAPQGCVVIEDSPSGVTAAMRAGMAVYGYAADSDAEELRRAGAEVVMSLSELSQPLLA